MVQQRRASDETRYKDAVVDRRSHPNPFLSAHSNTAVMILRHAAIQQKSPARIDRALPLSFSSLCTGIKVLLNAQSTFAVVSVPPIETPTLLLFRRSFLSGSAPQALSRHETQSSLRHPSGEHRPHALVKQDDLQLAAGMLDRAEHERASRIGRCFFGPCRSQLGSADRRQQWSKLDNVEEDVNKDNNAPARHLACQLNPPLVTGCKPMMQVELDQKHLGIGAGSPDCDAA